MYPAIEIFGFTLHTYGLCVLVGGILGILIAMWAGKKYGLTKLDILLFGMYAIIAGFIGAKLLYIIVEWDSVWQHPEALLTGGFVFYGGAIGGILGGWIYVKQYRKMSKLYLIEFLDVAAPAIAIGQAFGRVGCFLAGCCYGAPTDSPLGVCYPEGGIAPAGVKLLPTQLFETAFLLVFTVVLLIIIKKSKKRGTALAIYFIGYGVWRFIIEFFRSDPRGSVGALSTSQFISLFIVALGVIILVLRKVKGEEFFAKGLGERDEAKVEGAQEENVPHEQEQQVVDTESEEQPEQSMEVRPKDKLSEELSEQGPVGEPKGEKPENEKKEQ